MKIFKKYEVENIIPKLTILYGLVFIIIDIFHYFYGVQATKNSIESGGLYIFTPYEGIEIKICNIFVHIVLILAGISFYNKKPITWYLYNFAFIAMILKFPTFLFWSEYYIANWFASIGLSIIISIFGLIYFNTKKIKELISFSKKRTGITITLISVLLFSILSIFAYNIRWTIYDNLETKLNETITKNTTSKYKYHIKNIIDTLNVSWNNTDLKVG